MAQIPFIDLRAQRARIGEAMDAAIARVLAHGRYILGPEVEEFEAALDGLAVGQLLRGYRATGPADVGALIEAVQAVARLIETRLDIREIEINPLIVTGNGARAADALIKLDLGPQ